MSAAGTARRGLDEAGLVFWRSCMLDSARLYPAFRWLLGMQALTTLSQTWVRPLDRGMMWSRGSVLESEPQYWQAYLSRKNMARRERRRRRIGRLTMWIKRITDGRGGNHGHAVYVAPTVGHQLGLPQSLQDKGPAGVAHGEGLIVLV
ncbi:MAG: hypothetical protein OTJ97_01580 [SAR202 cluster bacterium]|nr:hypothetical protein [SAR202 cluster bacterium]